MYTTVTVLLHVQTLQDLTHVHVTILTQEMEKLAVWQEVNTSLRTCFTSNVSSSAVLSYNIESSLKWRFPYA